MRKNIIWVVFVLLLVTVSCSRDEKPVKTKFIAEVSVADSVDQSGDFSGFKFLIYQRENPVAAADTVFLAETDESGKLEGEFEVPDAGLYPLQLSRNGISLVQLNVAVADGDTIQFKAEFPNVEETLEIDSRENRAMRVYERVERGFQQTNAFILAGQIADSLIPGEFRKWSDLYWEVYEKHKGTLASKFALEGAISLLERINRPEMFARINQSFDEDLTFGLALTLGKNYVAGTRGLEAAIAYVDSVAEISDREGVERAAAQSIVKIYLDSAYVDKANTLLAQYAKKYNKKDQEPSFWYKNMRFELANLAPGMDIPAFEFATTEQDTITNTSLKGSAYVLEFTQMANKLYQSQYDEATVIFQLYAPQGLKYFTLPFDASSNTIIGFFQERDRFWSLVEPPSFDKKEVAEDFNIKYYPTRILVDANGKIVRKYVGDEFEDMIPDIITTLNK